MPYGALAGASIVDLRVPAWGASLAIVALTAIIWLGNEAATRSPWLGRLLSGSATVLIEGGRPLADNLRRAHLTERDLMAKLRELKLAGAADVELAVLETDGRIGVVPRRTQTTTPDEEPPA